MEQIKQFFDSLSKEQLQLIVLIAAAIIVLNFIIMIAIKRSLRKQRRAMSILVSLLGEETEKDIEEYLRDNKNAEKDLKNGSIAEYEKACGEIRRKYGAEKQRISGYYDAEIRRVSSEYLSLKAEANRMGNAHLMTQYQIKSNQETQALAAKKKAELTPIQNDEKIELENLREEYKEDLETYKNIKSFNKNISCLSKAFARARKKKIKLPVLDE